MSVNALLFIKSPCFFAATNSIIFFFDLSRENFESADLASFQQTKTGGKSERDAGKDRTTMGRRAFNLYYIDIGF
jgi:hypothetical protein